MSNPERPQNKRLRAFLRKHDIRVMDVAEQIADVLERQVPPGSAHRMLFKNKYMDKAVHSKLLSLGFPEGTLPPCAPVARFPGLEAKKEEQQATA